MTPQEHQALQTLLSQLVQVKNIPKDPEAEPMIARAVAQQPDAAYLLVQRAMILEQALEAAKAQISDLQQQIQSTPRSGRSFLDANTWGQSGRSLENHQMDTGRAGTSLSGNPLPPNPAQQYSTPPYAAQPASSRFFGGGAGSMLGTMAATAAGVAGGAFLFHGIESLLGHHHGQSSQGLLGGNNDQAQGLADASPSSLFSSSELDKLGPSGSENFDNSLAGQEDDGSLSDDLFASEEPQDDLFAGDDSGGDDSYNI